MPLLMASLLTLSGVTVYDQAPSAHASAPVALATPSPTTTPLPPKTPPLPVGASTQKAADVPAVPFFSQFKDITSPKWQKVGCGIADLAMIVNFYTPHAVTVDTLLARGIAADAYDYSAGWIYAGLIGLSHTYGLDGAYHDFTKLGREAAYTELAAILKKGPVIASVHYKLDPASTIPHLIVVNGIKDGQVYYNDPAAASGGRVTTKAVFQRAWKQKIIVIRPASKADLASAAQP